MEEYHRLKCDCGSDEFIAKTYLKWKKGSGLVMEPCGQKCARCNRNTVTAAMIKDVEMRDLERKIEELQKEKENATPPGNKVQTQEGKQPQAGVSGQQGR